MPRLNLKDDDLESDAGSERDIAPPPTLREVGGGGGKSPLLIIVLVLLALAIAVFALNYFNVIHLWGKKQPVVTETLPEPDMPMQDEGLTAEQGEGATGESVAPTTPAPEPTTAGAPPTSATTAPEVTPPSSAVKPTQLSPAPVLPPSGSGEYTVQVSSWVSRAKADEEAAKLTNAGMSAYVEDGLVGSETWYRVRVGHYATSQEAKAAADQLQKMMEGEVYVAKAGR